ncbi:MAG: SDR family oxidoreductase [Alphaproteobacteria bacterium]|nr:SDR family oxidoreductase [Alphaproteobacteria bacterium]
MDLGIGGKWAIVCAASKGLGKGSAVALAREGVNLVLNARGVEALEATAAEIRGAYPVQVHTLAGDVSEAPVRARLVAACPAPDILVNNAGGPPRGDFREFNPEDWQKAVNANMITPIELIKAVLDGMLARRFGRIVNITSASVKHPIPELCLSNGARAGLTGFVAGLSRQVARHNVIINNLLPGPFNTDRLRAGIRFNARAAGRSEAEQVEQMQARNPAGRFGSVEEFGAVCAFLCSQHVGFMTGQQVLLDGGAYPGTT